MGLLCARCCAKSFHHFVLCDANDKMMSHSSDEVTKTGNTHLGGIPGSSSGLICKMCAFFAVLFLCGALSVVLALRLFCN